MPKSHKFKNEKPSAGDPISAGDMAEVIRLAKQHQQLPGSMQVGGMLLQRPLPSGSNLVFVQVEDPIDAATNDGSHNTTPGTGACVIMEWNSTLGRYEPSTATDTLYNVGPAVLAEGATSSARVTLLVLNDNGRLTWNGVEGEKGDPGGSTAGGSGLHFEIAEDLTTSATSAKAIVLDDSGATIISTLTVAEIVATATIRKAMAEGAAAGQVEDGDIVQQTDDTPDSYWQYDDTLSDPSDDASWTRIITDCVIVDPLSWIEAWAPYTALDSGDKKTAGSSQRGFVGTGPAFTTDYNSTGLPGVYPDSIQGLVPLLLVELQSDVLLTTTVVTPILGYGANFCERMPKQETHGGVESANTATANFRSAGVVSLQNTGESFGLTVSNLTGSATGARAGERWIVAQTSKHSRLYELITSVQDAIIFRGVTTASFSGVGAASVTLAQPVYGPAPTGTIAVTTDASVRLENGETVYCIRDKTISGDYTKQWRLCSAFGVVQFLKGLPDFDVAANANQELSNIGGTVKWVNKPATTGGSDGSIIQRFELTSGLGVVQYGGSTIHRAAAVLVDEQGDATETVIYINDLNDDAFGLASYTAADGSASRGYRGHCVAYEDSTTNECILLDIEGPSETIVVQLRANMGAGINTCDYIERFGAYPAGKIPQKSGEGVLCRNDLNLSGLQGERWFAKWDTLEFAYELAHPVGHTDIIAVYVDEQTIGAATVSGGAVVCGQATVKLMEETGTGYAKVADPEIDVIVMNHSETPIIAANTQPLSLLCSKRQDGKYDILSIMDNRGLPGFVVGQTQIVGHQNGSSDFQAAPFCYESNYVFEVVVAGGVMEYHVHDRFDSCNELSTAIINVGPCAT